MNQNLEVQNTAFEDIYDFKNLKYFEFHFTKDKLVRYLRDRRLNTGLRYLASKYPKAELLNWKVLIVCGGVGGEGIYFINAGFKDVTSSDFSGNSIAIANRLCAQHEIPQLKTILLNAESVYLDDDSYDLVVVQDGLHHLPRPSLGFTEMLRVAKKAVIVIEPYDSLVGNMIGTEWEVHGDAVNYVYRWNRKMIRQIVKSYLLRNYDSIKVARIWDHSLTVNKIVHKFPKRFRLGLAKAIYSLLSLFNFSGNNMVAIITKNFEES